MFAGGGWARPTPLPWHTGGPALLTGVQRTAAWQRTGGSTLSTYRLLRPELKSLHKQSVTTAPGEKFLTAPTFLTPKGKATEAHMVHLAHLSPRWLKAELKFKLRSV